MQATPTELPEVLVLRPSVFTDTRGFFLESFNARAFAQAVGAEWTFVQDNHSHSVHGTLRGLHYQLGTPQGKLVRVVAGRVFDVAVDLRRSSPRFGHWVGVTLSADDRQQLWIPPGFAHGFCVLSASADVLYKATEYWDAAADRCIVWNDPRIGIAWPLTEPPLLSAKDQAGKRLDDAEVYA